eukprot:TRINITY_DN98073_c0_g1_i1.p1 TRINITY_DN98073_c0_g1~~TRINITY_DN98073_c0_g1_i1.p1  ORF type:complete len:257 (+),score=26.01 TRINITY_DN98073_c0_g1_i1:50-820(+)
MHARSRARLLRHGLSLLLLSMVASASISMLHLAFAGKPLRLQPLQLHASVWQKSRMGSPITQSAMPKDTISVLDFLAETNVDKAEVETLAAGIAKATTNGLWDMTDFEPLETELPKYERFMDGVQFQTAARKLSPGVSDAAIQAVFMVLAKGRAGFIQKSAVDPTVAGWSNGLDGTFDAGGFNSSWLVSKANIAFAYWFLNVFAPFCTYFFFIRGPLKSYVGIDLLPGVPNFWERGPPAAGAVQAVSETLASTPLP